MPPLPTLSARTTTTNMSERQTGLVGSVRLEEFLNIDANKNGP